jgi:hypothetical protein
MSLIKWREILAAYAVIPDEAGRWKGMDNAQVDGVFDEIAGVVRAARAELERYNSQGIH